MISSIEKCVSSEKQDCDIAKMLRKIIKNSDQLRIDDKHKECYYYDIDNFEWKVDVNGETIFQMLCLLFYERAGYWYCNGAIELAYEIAKIVIKFNEVSYRKKIIGMV